MEACPGRVTDALGHRGRGMAPPGRAGGLTVNLILKPGQCIRKGLLRTHGGGGLWGFLGGGNNVHES